jgi:hypothetical protein
MRSARQRRAPTARPSLAQVAKYCRVFEANVGNKRITLKQELYTRQALQADGTPTKEGPKICKIKMQLLS